MAKIQITAKYAKQQFKRLKLKNGEVARIAVVDPDPEMAYQHWTQEFKGVICVGRTEVLDQSGSDPDTCPLCAVGQPSKVGQQVPVSTARRYFALPVFRYNIDSKKKPLLPVSGEVITWVFSDDKFGKLLGLIDEYGDLRKRDIRLDCEPAGELYQKMDIKITDGAAVWLMDKSTADAVSRQFADERPKNIEGYFGRKFSVDTLRDLAARVTGRPQRGDEEDTSAAADSLLSGLGGFDVEGAALGSISADDLLSELD